MIGNAESFYQYFTKFAASGCMIIASFMDSLDGSLRILAALLGAILSVYTIIRMSKDIKIRNEELKIKKLERQERELNLEQLIKDRYNESN